ncbi:hypothetical protein KI387_004501, partial [Taxus chinensis]
VQAWETSNRQGSNPFIGHDLGPLFYAEKETKEMVDHSGNKLESPRTEFDFDPTLLDEFLLRNKDRVLAWVVELGAKLPIENEPILQTNDTNEEERPLINLEDILTCGHASTSYAENDKVVGHRIPLIKVPRRNKIELEIEEEPPQYKEEEPLEEEVINQAMIQQQISKLSWKLAFLTSHVQKDANKNIQKLRPK